MDPVMLKAHMEHTLELHIVQEIGKIPSIYARYDLPDRIPSRICNGTNVLLQITPPNVVTNVPLEEPWSCRMWVANDQRWS